jgi:long-chain acyl-CoA synthetase
MFDQACLAQGLVVVPIFVEDRPENIVYVLEQTETSLLFLDSVEQWERIDQSGVSLNRLTRVVIVKYDAISDDTRVVSLDGWLGNSADQVGPNPEMSADDLATIVYTSGTTGRPKGVMLSHGNILSNASAGLHSFMTLPDDRLLSFLPLSHMFERTVGYYLTMMAGTPIAFNRSVPELIEDLGEIQPTGLITVPIIFEKALGKIRSTLDEGPAFSRWIFEKTIDIGWQRFEHSQGRAKWKFKQLLWPLVDFVVAKKVREYFGGKIRFVISGGARLAPNVSRVFIGMGMDILQGYGLTESSPVLTSNTLARNKPSTIGLPFAGVEIRLGENDELQARGPNIMLGYWKDPEATAKVLDQDRWLSTGDAAKIDSDGFVFITGRLKEIIVLANGEKVPPADMESAICDDPLFEHAMVLGEGKPYLTAILSLNPELWPQIARRLELESDDDRGLDHPDVIIHIDEKIKLLLSGFPSYAFIRHFTLTNEQWSVGDGTLTPTLKLKRPVLMKRFANEIAGMYSAE